MIHNMAGGGGAGLNFKVVSGLTRPANPVENTIWVPTDTDISSYAFSATEPRFNRITYPFVSSNQTVNGTTWTDNGDGTLTVNGTTTGSTYYVLSNKNDTGRAVELEAGTYTMSLGASNGNYYQILHKNYTISCISSRAFSTIYSICRNHA